MQSIFDFENPSAKGERGVSEEIAVEPSERKMNPDRNSRKYRSGNNLYSDDELELSSSQVLEKVKPDRVTSTKPDEDRRRRTIIVEKKNGSYGFTLQSYGIHYKKEQEVEVITYVDYVEYDGPAYRAGMREGDVILSINGYDMEKAEHKDLVNFIKNCDNRMRMVVLFEDCCRKVELHLKYIQLQDLLKSKMADLERICLRERELLEGKWKTHSLPARKKATATSTTDDADPGSTTDVESGGSGPSFCRPAASTEDVKKLLRQKTYIVPPPAQFMLAYHCLDSNYRYVIHPSQAGTCDAASGTEYSTCAQQPQGNPTAAKLCKDHQHMMRGSSLDSSSLGGGCKQQQQQQQQQSSPTKSLHNYDTKAASGKSGSGSRRSGHLHGHSCNPCMGHFLRSSSSSDKGRGGGADKDNTSLDAYDLASPCCDPQCVPSRRKSKHHKDHHHKHKHRDREGKESGGKDRIPRPKSQPHISPQQQQQPQQQQHQSHTQSNYLYRHKDKHDHHHTKVYDLNASLASHCSLHSCTSSEFNPAAENSPASYSTSISTDTLYWEPHSESTTVSASGSLHKKPPAGSGSTTSGALVPLSSGGGRPPHTHQHHYYIQKYVHPQHHAGLAGQQGAQQPLAIYPPPPPLPATVHKPKSWDNLAMKGYGGYGYGYGYLEVGAKAAAAAAAAAAATTNLPTATRTQTTITIQHRNSIPKRNGYERYSAFVDVENYAPPPTQFLQETTTTTTTITTKSTENLLGGPYNRSDSSLSCECLETAPLTVGAGTSGAGLVEHVHDKAGYYSTLAGGGGGGGASGSGKKSNPNLTEIARL
uniref:PDZ domain-containing protein n=1 Tax=Anopheles merus TaxID=30066 RepID=A0A182UUK8_ANOME